MHKNPFWLLRTARGALQPKYYQAKFGDRINLVLDLALKEAITTGIFFGSTGWSGNMTHPRSAGIIRWVHHSVDADLANLEIGGTLVSQGRSLPENLTSLFSTPPTSATDFRCSRKSPLSATRLLGLHNPNQRVLSCVFSSRAPTPWSDSRQRSRPSPSRRSCAGSRIFELLDRKPASLPRHGGRTRPEPTRGDPVPECRVRVLEIGMGENFGDPVLRRLCFRSYGRTN